MYLVEDGLRRWVIIVVLAFTFSLAYVDNALFNDGSFITNIATFHIGMPHKTRILLPYILYHIFPHHLLDTFRFRVAFSTVFAALGLYTFPYYWERIVGKTVNRMLLSLILFTMMLAHYAVSKWDQVFYIYDIPMIVFSMWSFLLLTSDSTRLVLLGGLAIFIFSFSKETVVSALVAALAYRAYDWWRASPRRATEFFNLPVIVALASGVLIVVSRAVVTRLVGGGGGDYASLLFTEGQLRFWFNCLQVARIHGALVAFLLWGCGVVVWLPLFWGRLNPRTKWLMTASAPPFMILLFVDNFVELRCYSELLPLMAVGFGQVLLLKTDPGPGLAAARPPQP